MDNELNYGQLYQILQDMHFSDREVEVEGKRQYLFEHESRKGAILFLPIREAGEIVEPFFLHSAVVMLKAQDLIADSNLPALLRAHQAPAASETQG